MPLVVDPDQRTTRMAWTAEDRRRYAPAVEEMVRQGMLVRLAATIDRIDPPSRVGRPRLWSTLIMLQALWHLARDGCAWRRLPPGLPPHQSVWGRFSRWRLRAVLDRALAVLVACRRLAAGTQDRDALESLAPALAAHASLLLVWLDRGFAGEGPRAFLQRHGITAEIVGTSGRKGFQVEPRRWKAEQTFGCLQRHRRLRIDDEASLATARAMTLLASVFMTGMRLERMFQT